VIDGRRLLLAAGVVVVGGLGLARTCSGPSPSTPSSTSTSATAVEQEAVSPPSDPGGVMAAPPAAPSTAPPSTTASAQLGEAELAEAVASEDEVVAPADQWRGLLASDAPREGLFRLIADPRSSDLPAAAAARAASAGSTFVVADASGEGREAFPGWWGDRPAVPVATGVRVLAAGAASAGRLVQVVVVWDGTSPAGVPLGERTSTVFFELNGSVLMPVHPGDVG